MHKPQFGIHWQEKRLTDLEFADNLALFADKGKEMRNMTQYFEEKQKFKRLGPRKINLYLEFKKLKQYNQLFEYNQPLSNGHLYNKKIDF